MRTPRGPGHRAGLTADAVLQAARRLLADGGADALTMRALARQLGVAPNALYSHVASKAGLLDEVLDDVLGQVPAPTAADPVAGLVELTTTTYDVLTGHPGLVPLYLARQGARGPQAVRLGAVMDDLLSSAGASGPEIAHARRALIIHALGSAAFAVSAGSQDGAADDGEATGAGSRVPLDADQSRQTFVRGLAWLLTGIVRSSSAP